MSAAKPFLTIQIFLCFASLCVGNAIAQAADRILKFYAEIQVDRNRTLRVQEKFEIANEVGLFDAGFHRKLAIKGVNPQRSKARSFLPISAKIDGHDAVLRASENGEIFDIEILPETGNLSRGNHLIELSYKANHQFAIYDDFEDLNQDISGEWPVPIEKATVALSLPEGLPKESGISADTGSSSQFQFDCVRTDLPSGVQFETTHSLPPGDRLFISARFPHSGYFVSGFEEDGVRAVLQNHPWLIPGLAFLLGSIVFASVAVVIWRRVSKSLGTTPALSAADWSPPAFWREVLNIYLFPMIMFALAMVPGLNFTYSGHGGISWFFLPLCFPWVIARILVKIARGVEASRVWYKRFFKITIPSYIALALPLSWAAAASIHTTFGLPISTWSFFLLMISPFPWWYFT